MLEWSLNYILVEEVRRLSVTSCSAERFSITFMYVLLDLSKDVFSKQLISLIIALCLKLILFEVLRIKISNSQNSLFFLRFSAILLWVEGPYRQNLCYTERMLGWSVNDISVEEVLRLSVTSRWAERLSITFMYVFLGFLKAACQSYHRFMSKVNIIWGAWH